MDQHISKTCSLCDLKKPLNPPSHIWQNKEFFFCCTGCKQVFIILSENRLIEGDYKKSDIYKTSVESGIIGSESELKKKKPSYDSLTEIKELNLQVSGMWCSACSWLIEKVVDKEDGILETQVIFSTDSISLKYYPQKISKEKIKQLIKKLGYDANERMEETSKTQTEKSKVLLKMGIAVFIAVNIMMLNSVIYVGYFQKISKEIFQIISLVLWILATPSVFWCGSSIHKKGLKSLFSGSYTMELLLSLGILIAYFYSVFLFFKNDPHIYFDTAANLVALVMVGKFFETAARHKTAGNIIRLYQMFPKKVRIKTSSGERFVSIKKLNIGDIFVVKPGEKIPADGTIIKGKTKVDESLITGESQPILKNTGSNVIGSSLNINGNIEVKTDTIGKDSILAKIIKLVEKAFIPKSKIEKMVDKISKWFIPLILFISFSTIFFLLLMGYGFESSLLRGLTVLVIACPCSLGIATPLAITAGIGYAAKRGILIKDGTVFNKLAKLQTIYFDKTGTLTAGNFAVLNHFTSSTDPEKKKEALRYIKGIEQKTEHPIAKAIVNYCHKNKIVSIEPEEHQFFDGLGIKGKYIKNTILIGNMRLFEKESISLDQSLLKIGKKEEIEGNTVIYYYINNINLFGILILGDKIKTDAKNTIKKLSKEKISIKILSGDSNGTTASIAKKIGIKDFYSQLLPEQKTEIIKKKTSSAGITAMIGDGINDAPSLAHADIGIAIGSGTDIAIESSDIVLLNKKLIRIWESIDISKRTIKTIKQNLIWAFTYNIIGIFLAILGYLNPLMAAIAMLISSISVVANSLRLHSGPKKTIKKIKEILFPWIEK